jgi:hypothetical protein
MGEYGAVMLMLIAVASARGLSEILMSVFIQESLGIEPTFFLLVG